jgi:hypothetical protein
MGMTEECGIGQFYRRAVLNAALFGSTAVHAERNAARLAAQLQHNADATRRPG